RDPTVLVHGEDFDLATETLEELRRVQDRVVLDLSGDDVPADASLHLREGHPLDRGVDALRTARGEDDLLGDGTDYVRDVAVRARGGFMGGEAGGGGGGGFGEVVPKLGRKALDPLGAHRGGRSWVGVDGGPAGVGKRARGGVGHGGEGTPASLAQ